MTASVINFKPIPIFVDDDFYYCSDREIDAIKSNEHHVNLNGGGTHVTVDGNIFNQPHLHNLRDAIVERFDAFIEKVMGINNKFKMERSWSTWNVKGTHHTPHTHPNIVWSAVYYAKCTEGTINFETDNGRASISDAFNFKYELNHRNVYNSEMWSVPVKTGTLLIFPGHIVHHGEPHPDDSERLMIGTNWFPRGEFYSSDSKLEVINL